MIVNKRIYHDIWNSDIVVMFRRLGLIYLILMVCRVVFYFYNRSIIGDIDSSELWLLFKGSLQFDSISIIYGLGLFMLLSIFPLRIRERAWWQTTTKWCAIVFVLIITFLNLGDAIYFRYTQVRFSADDLFFVSNDNINTLIGQFALENWYLVILWLGLSIFLWYGWRWCGTPKTAIKNRYVYIFINTLISILVIVLILWVVRGCRTLKAKTITTNKTILYTNSIYKASMILSNPFCILRSYGKTKLVEQQYFMDSDLNNIFSLRHAIDTLNVNDEYFGSMKGKNIFIFTLESFGAELSALLSPDIFTDGQESYTPFLDSLMRKGLVMTRSYSNGGKSIEALPSILGSMPSFKSPFVLMRASFGKSKQLPKYLMDNGYETAFFCGSPKGSMGFDTYATFAGINNTYSMDEYNQTKRERAYDGNWGIWDEEFFDYTGEILSQMQQPFFGTIFTVSSHHPFVVPSQYEKTLPKGNVKIHKPAAYTDLSIRSFFAKYSDDDWFKNTLFVFIADHVSSEKYSAQSKTYLGRHHIVTAFYTPDGSLRGEYNSIFTQLDVMPTLLGLLGNREPYYAFGRDIFNEPNRKPLLVNYENDFIVASDSLTVLFNDERDEIVGVYSSDDALMSENLYLKNSVAIKTNREVLDNMNKLKGILQQYYKSIINKKYIVD